jgi:flagellar basal-body rod protein FlgC
MTTVSSIALSGLQAASARLEAAASNIANAQTTGQVPNGPATANTVYEPVDVVQVDTGNAGQPQSVGYSFAARPGAYNLVYQPDSPVANSDGMVAAPDVDLASELVSMMVAKYQYLGSAAMVTADDDMMRSSIDVLA